MKKTTISILCFCIWIMSPLAGQAQNTISKSNDFKPRNEFQVGLSDGIPVHVVYAFKDILTSVVGGMVHAITGTHSRYKELETTDKGIPLFVNVNYYHELTRKVYIGGSASYMGFQNVHHYRIVNSGELFDVHEIRRDIILLATFRYDYIQKPKFSFYGKVGIGGMYDLDKSYSNKTNIHRDNMDQNLLFAFQINPLCIEYGGDFGGYLELGFGMQGLAQLGVFYRL